MNSLIYAPLILLLLSSYAQIYFSIANNSLFARVPEVEFLRLLYMRILERENTK